ncbi:MAG TPA: ribonuclease D [Gammaproteobacteria bacterium]|nr:ribonuclease D [Gammaproteobacteria bacterium]
MRNDVQYIDSAPELVRFCTRLAATDWFALDTEFLREKTYFPKLCLLQIATPESVACIDPLALDSLDPILDLIYDAGITKVMHSARQDMEIFYHLRGTAPGPVFDTQVAGLLLGYPDQIGYGNLVREVLGVDLEKLHTRADWSVRPLTQDQVAYAADDVIYLVDVYQKLHARLTERGRLEWLDEDFARLSSDALYSNPPDEAWLRVKGGNRLKGAALAVLQALAAWRESQAQQRDRPRGWILRDDALIEIARHRPASIEELGRIRGLQEAFLRHNGEQMLALVARAAKQSPAPFPDNGPRLQLTPEQDALVDVMSAVVRISGNEHALNPTVLATRKQLERLVTGDADVDVMHGWRRKLVGERLQKLLRGELSLSVRDGKLDL